MAEVSSSNKTYFQHDYATGKIYLKFKDQQLIPKEWEKLAKPFAPSKGKNAGVVHWRVFFDSISIQNCTIETADTEFGQQYRIEFTDMVQGNLEECCLSLPCDDLTALKLVLALKRHPRVDVKWGKFPTLTNGKEVIQSEVDFLFYDQEKKEWVKNPAFLPEAGKATWYKACEFALPAGEVEQGKKEIGIPQKQRVAIPKSGATFWKAYTVTVRAYVDLVEGLKPQNVAASDFMDISALDDSEDLPF